MNPFLKNNNQNKTDVSYLFFLLPILALIAPVILLPIEKIIPYPYILEEMFKATMVFLILTIPGKSFQIKLTIFLGFFFALSENFFYLSNSILYGSPAIFIERFFLASILHIFTILIILLSAQKNRRLIFPAALLAMLIHYFYNQSVMFLLK
ncbi:MAG: PrsW family glutamic-type intramembrane protease [Candidatus Moranbacteria bacterium]|nr:PrsW family glutamic-type intramembrane protease [Candidatus Moranbacteria bacterium]